MIPLLSAAWLLTVKPAHAQYPSGGNTSNTGFMNNGQPPINNNTGNNSGSTGYPGGSTGYPGGNTGYPGSTDGSNTGYTGIVGGTNSGYPGNNNGTGTGYPGSTGGGTGTGYPGSTGGNNTGYPGGGTNGTGYPGSTGGSNTGYPGSTGGNNSGSNTGYPGGGTGGTGTGYPGGGTNSGNTGGTGTGGSGTGYPGGGTGTGYPGGGTGTGTGGTGTGTGTGGGTITPGHWDVSYSSKSATTSWDYVGYDANYKSTAKSDSRQWPATGSGDGVQDGSYLDAKMTGTVTATLTWVPTTGQDATSDPPSSSVIVTEYAGASARGGSGTGKADDGWGDTSDQGGYPGSGASSGSSPGYASSSGTHYEVKDGSSGSITVTSGTLSASTPDNTTPDANGNFSGLGVLVSTGFNVAGANATISLPGTSTDTDGSKKALTGQQVTARLDNAPPHVTSYTWSFTGGTPIKNWDPYGKAADGTPQQFFPFTDADKTGTDKTGSGILVPDLSFYDQSADTVTVKCVVNYMLPKDGNGNAKSGSMTVTSKSITFLKPTASWAAYSTDPFINTTSSIYGTNVVWRPVIITVPPLKGVSGGTGCFVQLITPSRQATRHPAPGTSIMALNTYYAKNPVTNPDGSTGWVLPTQGLDGGFPYDFGYKANPDGSPGDPVKSNYMWDVSSTGISGDRPGASYYPAVVSGDSGGSDWYTATTQDKFTTWVMCKATSTNAIWVPLKKLDWSTNITVSNATGTWAISPGNTVNTPPSGTNASDFPSWTNVNIASQAAMRP